MNVNKTVSRRIFMRPWKEEVPAHFLVGAVIAVLLLSFYGGNLLAPVFGSVNGLILGSCAAVLFFFGGAFLLPPSSRGAARIGLRKVGRRELLLCAAALFVMLAGSSLLVCFWQQLLDFFNISYEKEQGLLVLAKGADSWTLLRLLLLTAVLVPFMEELVFRRCLYALLLKLGAPLAMTGTALIFAAAHGFLLGFPGLFFMGVIFQILCNVTRNLWCSIIAHSMLNASVLLISWTAARAGAL